MTDAQIVCPGCGKRRPGFDVYERAKASGDWTEWADADRAYSPCCNQLCGGTWGTGCHHCHHPRFWPTCVYRRWAEARVMSHIQSPHALLSALALEIDERMATPTGERVCRTCGERGDVWEWGRRRVLESSDPTGSMPIPSDRHVQCGEAMHRHTRRSSEWIADQDSERWAWRRPCTCDGPMRPDTVQLHSLVDDLSALPSPRFAWPDHWLTIADDAEAHGGWVGRWWIAFREWTWAGKVPDAEALARDLAALIPTLEKRERAKRVRS